MPLASARLTIALSVGSPNTFRLPSSSLPMVATQARHKFFKKSICESVKFTSSATGSEPYTHSLLTVILFMVRVPVLSEHITEVEPRVSTACICRTRAFFAAIFFAPCASVKVTIKASVSGTAATARVTEIIIMCMASCLYTKKPTTNIIIAEIMARPEIIFPTLSRRTCKVVFCCLVSVKKRAILPISVSMPVPTTIAAALPAVTRQPE